MDALTADEIRRTVEILRSAGRTDETANFATLTLHEDDKEVVRAWQPGQPFARRAFAVVMQHGRVYEAVVNVGEGQVERWDEIAGVRPADPAVGRDERQRPAVGQCRLAGRDGPARL